MISIIIPVYNESENLHRLIPKLLDISTDKTEELIICVSPLDNEKYQDIEKYDRVQLVKSKKHGRAAQMNRGAENALGKVIAFLHADVLPPGTFYEDIKQAIQDGFDAGCFAYTFDKNNLLLKINAAMTCKKTIFTGGGDQCLFMTTKTFKALGRFDESQIIMEDYELYDRIKKSKTAFKIIPNPLVVSARKYDNRSYFRVNASNLLLFVMFKLGLDAKRIKSLHESLF